MITGNSGIWVNFVKDHVISQTELRRITVFNGNFSSNPNINPEYYGRRVPGLLTRVNFILKRSIIGKKLNLSKSTVISLEYRHVVNSEASGFEFMLKLGPKFFTLPEIFRKF